MTDKIKVDIVSDVVCPWCIVGYKRLISALSELGLQEQFEIEWRPFQLNPDMMPEGENLQAHMSNKYGMTPVESRQTLDHMASVGAELGFTFDFYESMKMVNTQDAHILLDYAKESGKGTELKLRLFAAFFSEQKDVSNRLILAAELQAVGMNVDDALERLNDAATRIRVQNEELYWKNRGVSAVPTIIFNNSNSVVAAQPVDAYKEIITELVALI